MKKNVIPKKKLRTYVGKLESIASLLYTLRPFVSPIWASLYADCGQAPRNCVWTSMIEHSLTWLAAFFLESGTGPLQRIFRVDAHFNRGRRVRITTDASPYGIGGWISIDGVLIAYFFEPPRRPG